jgi:hypothetical protein
MAIMLPAIWKVVIFNFMFANDEGIQLNLMKNGILQRRPLFKEEGAFYLCARHVTIWCKARTRVAVLIVSSE